MSPSPRELDFGKLDKKIFQDFVLEEYHEITFYLTTRFTRNARFFYEIQSYITLNPQAFHGWIDLEIKALAIDVVFWGPITVYLSSNSSRLDLVTKENFLHDCQVLYQATSVLLKAGLELIVSQGGVDVIWQCNLEEYLEAINSLHQALAPFVTDTEKS